MKIGFIPYTRRLLDNKLFSTSKYDLLEPYGADLCAFRKLKQNLQANGHVVKTIDRFQIGSIDLCVFIDINYWYLKKIKNADDPPMCVYLMRDSPAFISFNTTPHIKRYLPLFDAVVSWNPDIANLSSKCHKYHLPYYYPRIDRDMNSFEENSLICNVSSRKYSSHPDELYSTREDLICYLNKHYNDQSSLFGKGWNGSPGVTDISGTGVFRPSSYSTYSGMVNTKREAYHSHRFAIAFENVVNVRGYVTEKLFDCLRYGIVPVYWGADNIDSCVPPSCFVDYRNYNTPEELMCYLSDMSESEYNEYIDSAQVFLESKQAEQFTAENFATTLSEYLRGVEHNSKHSIPDRLFEEIKVAVYCRLS